LACARRQAAALSARRGQVQARRGGLLVTRVGWRLAPAVRSRRWR